MQIFDILKFANGFLSIRTFGESHKSAYYRQTNGGHEEMLINENGINLHSVEFGRVFRGDVLLVAASTPWNLNLRVKFAKIWIRAANIFAVCRRPPRSAVRCWPPVRFSSWTPWGRASLVLLQYPSRTLWHVQSRFWLINKLFFAVHGEGMCD